MLVDYIRTSVEVLLNMKLDKGLAQSLANQVALQQTSEGKS